jgi:hypothetical protein
MAYVVHLVEYAGMTLGLLWLSLKAGSVWFNRRMRRR